MLSVYFKICIPIERHAEEAGRPEVIELLQRHIEALEREADGDFVLPADETEFDSFDEQRHEYDNVGFGAPMVVAATEENTVLHMGEYVSYLQKDDAVLSAFVWNACKFLFERLLRQVILQDLS